MPDEPVYRVVVTRIQTPEYFRRYSWEVYRVRPGKFLEKGTVEREAIFKVCSSYSWSFKSAQRQAERAADKDSYRRTYDYLPGQRLRIGAPTTTFLDSDSESPAK